MCVGAAILHCVLMRQKRLLTLPLVQASFTTRACAKVLFLFVDAPNTSYSFEVCSGAFLPPRCANAPSNVVCTERASTLHPLLWGDVPNTLLPLESLQVLYIPRFVLMHLTPSYTTESMPVLYIPHIVPFC